MVSKVSIKGISLRYARFITSLVYIYIYLKKLSILTKITQENVKLGSSILIFNLKFKLRTPLVFSFSEISIIGIRVRYVELMMLLLSTIKGTVNIR